MKLLPLTMGTWRRIEKLEIEIEESQKKLLEQCKMLEKVNNTFFDVFSKKMETTIAENNALISTKKTEIVNCAFGGNHIKDNVDQLYIYIKNEIAILLNKKATEMPEAKESKTNYEKMNAYQQVIHLYSILHREYRWTRKIIDNEEIEYIYDLTIVQALGNQEKEVPIDSVL